MEPCSKRHVLGDGRGVRLSLVVSAANVHDCKRLDAQLQAIQVKRANPRHRHNKHLCADTGYRGAEHRQPIRAHGYIAHVASVVPKKSKQTARSGQQRPALGAIADSTAFASCWCATQSARYPPKQDAPSMRNLFGVVLGLTQAGRWVVF
ncbi:MAG: transposase [Burkholderiaceae bacterium]|nr:transposase [Burkholderiaceae bacterium]